MEPTDRYSLPQVPLGQQPVALTTIRLSLLDRLLWLWVLLAMAIGLLLGAYVPAVGDWLNAQRVLDGSVSLVIFVGLLWMMYPVLCKVRFEQLFAAAATAKETSGHVRRRWLSLVAFSLFVNWVVGPLIMTAVAWMALPDLPGYRAGVIMVGLARCIAMVLLWNQLAGGDEELCVLLVACNSLLQIVLYSPYSYLFVNVLGGMADGTQVGMWLVAKNVLLFLGVPLVAAAVTRLVIRQLLGKQTFYDQQLMPILGPTALISLLLTIVAMFTLQGDRILADVGHVARIAVPLALYFLVMFGGVFLWCARGLRQSYEVTVTQSFTAASNNFELAIAVSIGVWGIESEQALAAVVGPLIEVPVMLALVYLAQYWKKHASWISTKQQHMDQEMSEATMGEEDEYEYSEMQQPAAVQV